MKFLIRIRELLNRVTRRGKRRVSAEFADDSGEITFDRLTSLTNKVKSVNDAKMSRQQSF